MARRTVDIVAAGPPSSDLYDTAAPAWALAGGLAARGHSVLVTYPGPAEAPPAPVGVEVVPFSPVTAHLGSALGDAELARSAAHHLRPRSEVIVRDPSGLGSLGHHAGHRPVASFVRTLAVDEAAASPPEPKAGGLGSKVFSWGERRGLRRLEKEALGEATVVYCASTAQRDRIRSDYGLEAGRLRVVASAVARGPEPPTREAARRLLEVPDDVPLVVILPPADPAHAEAVPAALEAFRRTRPIFPGARVAVVGVAEPLGPGVIMLPSREASSVAAAVAAADIAVASSPGGGLDPGLVLALRAGVASIVSPTADLGEGGDAAARRANLADAGELASVLAGLIADPEDRHTLGEAARTLARRFDPDRLVDELESLAPLSAR
jgi:glycosyltransferase involved in cell wall biosynthesis